MEVLVVKGDGSRCWHFYGVWASQGPPTLPLYELVVGVSTAACPLCSFESEISGKNQEQASLTRQRLQLEKEQKKLQRQQEKKVGRWPWLDQPWLTDCIS